jgi:hypothetical protein
MMWTICHCVSVARVQAVNSMATCCCRLIVLQATPRVGAVAQVHSWLVGSGGHWCQEGKVSDTPLTLWDHREGGGVQWPCQQPVPATVANKQQQPF